MQFGSLARMLQADPPPKAVKVTMSKRVPLVGDELVAYEEEQKRLKKEEELKANMVKEEESKVQHGPEDNLTDPMVIDSSNTIASPDGNVQSVCMTFVMMTNTFETILLVAPLKLYDFELQY